MSRENAFTKARRWATPIRDLGIPRDVAIMTLTLSILKLMGDLAWQWWAVLLPMAMLTAVSQGFIWSAFIHTRIQRRREQR